MEAIKEKGSRSPNEKSDGKKQQHQSLEVSLGAVCRIGIGQVLLASNSLPFAFCSQCPC